MAVVVSDTSPLRALQFLGLLDLLPRLYPVVMIPPAVVRELQQSSRRVLPLPIAAMQWIQVREPSETDLLRRLRATLDEGEADALGLAVEVHAEAVLMDDRAGRAAAAELGLLVVGALGVLLELKRQKLIDQIRPRVDSLRSGLPFAMSDDLLAEVLRRAGE